MSPTDALPLGGEREEVTLTALWLRLRWWILGTVALVLLGLRGMVWAVEWWWYDSLGYGQVWLTGILARAVLVVVGLILAGLLLLGSFRLSQRLGSVPEWAERDDDGFLTTGAMLWVALPWLLTIGTVVAALMLGRHWQLLLLLKGAVPAGWTDPVFGRDAAFYLFPLPFWTTVQRWLLGLAVLTWLGLYFRYTDLPQMSEGELVGELKPMDQVAKAHLAGHGALVFLLLAWQFYLSRFNLLVSSRTPVLHGIGFTDEHARLPLLTVLVIASLVAAVSLAINVRRRSTAQFGWTLGGFALAMLVSGAGPAIYQRLVVTPNELDRERPYLERTIAATRHALGLEGAAVRQYDVVPKIDESELAGHAETMSTIPLWSPAEISEQLVGTETLRSYYNFTLTDFDRYEIGGERQQVALMLRELQVDRLDPRAQSWVNRHLVYTHGYGLVMASAKDVGPAGEPIKLIGDIPPVTPPDLPLTRPEIYYGEGQIDLPYIITGLRAGSGTREFDYPSGEDNVYTSYEGDGGFLVGGLVRRLALAMRFRSINILFSPQLTANSRFHFRRGLQQRLPAIASFLDFDSDPYPVLVEGRIHWVVDAYTFADGFPYGWRYPLYPAAAVASENPLAATRRNVAYLRNSVKVVMDAYTGAVTFYLVDPECVVARTLQRVFPDLFTEAPMPAALAKQIRYPNDLFTLQARAYARFHMQDPDVFYANEDLWDLAREETVTRRLQGDGSYTFERQTERMQPYYVLLRLPGEAKAQFRLIVPFTPATTDRTVTGRDNMIGWLTANCEPGDGYGQLYVFHFPKNRLVFGPMQVEALISQDPYISEQLTLWSEEGSRVLRGRMLVVPLGRSLLYVEPLYITAERRGALPELKRVVVYYSGRVAMAPTLDEAVTAALQGTTYASRTVELRRVRRQVDAALEAYRSAEAALAAGQLAEYGRQMDQVKRSLTRVRTAVPTVEEPGASDALDLMVPTAPAESAPADSGVDDQP